MSQNVYYPNFQPVGYWGGILRAVLGRGGGKFKSSAQNYFPINQKIILIDTAPGSLMNVAMQVPHLNTVISTGAELFSLMKIKHVDKEGEEIENSEVIKFLSRPNPLQSLTQFLYEFYVVNAVYNKTFQHKVAGLSFEKLPSALWLLPSGWMKINATGKIYRQTKLENIIENFALLGDREDIFETDKIIYMAEGVGNNILNPVSRIESLQIPLSNIVASLKSRNIIVSQRGAIGMFSRNSTKDGDGFLPPDAKEKQKVEDQYQSQYDLDSQRGHVMITSDDYKWVPITFDVNQLGLTEGVEEDFSQVIAAYRHDRDVYPSTKGATFENKSAGMSSTIQNALQPLADKLMEQWTKNFIGEDKEERLVACYDHLPTMKEDELKRAQVDKTEAERLSIIFRDGAINLEEYCLQLGIEFANEKNAPQNAAQANLRGLVGSVTGIIQVNQFVAQGFIDKPTAANILMSVYGYDPPTANAMITTLTVDINTPAPSTSIPKE